MPALQSTQIASAVALQAVAILAPGRHTVQATQAPLAFKYWPAGQRVHSVALGPLQLAQLGWQAEHTRSAVATQGELWYWPAGQAPLQALHCAPSRKPPAEHCEHWESLAFVHVMADAHPATGVHGAHVSIVPLTRYVPGLQLPHC